jgi:hypothetical protein
MNRIRKYIPNVCHGGFERESYVFSSLKELMNTPIIKRDINWAKKYFKNVTSMQYLVGYDKGTLVLKCEYIKNEKKNSYIVGALDNKTCLN